jgi:hypothetical protein
MLPFKRFQSALLSILLAACVSGDKQMEQSQRGDTTPGRPSIAATRSISFDGSTFTLKYHVARDGQVLSEYYLAGETPEAWTRLVDLRVYPADAKSMPPRKYAVIVGMRLMAVNPKARYALHENEDDDTATLEYVTWDDAILKADRLECASYRFYTDPVSGDLMSFHFAEKVQMDPRSSVRESGERISAAQERISLEMAAVPLYQH